MKKKMISSDKFKIDRSSKTISISSTLNDQVSLGDLYHFSKEYYRMENVRINRESNINEILGTENDESCLEKIKFPFPFVASYPIDINQTEIWNIK